MELTALTREDIQSLADNRRVFAGGEEYARTGMIFRFSVTPTGISARVHGHYGDYTTTVTPDLKTRCTCPYEGTVCKHVIAVLLRYLDNGYAQVGDLTPGVPSALEQTLTEMPDRDLRSLVLRLVRDDAGVRRALLENVTVAPALLRAQPTDAKQVQALKKAVDKAFGELDGEAYEYYEGETRVDLGFIFDAAPTLHPDDQTEVLWHVVERGNEYIGEYDLGTDTLEQAIGLYGSAVARLEPPAREKRAHLDTLMEGLHWTMCGYGDVSEVLHDALDAIATAPEDVRHVIRTLEKSGEAAVRDWAISLYRRMGDDAGYLKARQANLHTEAQHLELADFFDERDQSAQSLATLESWITSRDNPQEGVRSLTYRPEPASGHGGIIRRLVARYTEAQDEAGLCRTLMAQARQEGVTLALYTQAQTVAEMLGTWAEHRPELLKHARGVERARIYLHEGDWERAIEFARLPGTEERVQALVADAVKEQRPDEAIALYDALVRANLGQSNRNGYRAAARYAGEVKRIYRDVAGDGETAAQYIADIRKANPRRPALQEEFRGL